MKKLIPAILLAFTGLYSSAQTAGVLDSSFADNGIALTTLGVYNEGRAVAVQPDGKILVLVYLYDNVSFYPYGALLRYNTDGSQDTDFGDNGIAQADIPDFSPKIVWVLSNGDILVAGTSLYSSIYSKIFLVRFHENGSLDASFGQGGVVQTSSSLNIHSIQRLPNGKFIAGGASYDDNFNQHFALMRLQPNGNPDLAFNFDGTVHVPGTSDAICQVVAGLPDGKIIAAGGSGGSGYGEFTLMRFLANGGIDSTFGTAGKTVTTFGANDDYVTALAIQPDGKIIAGGIYHKTPENSEFALVRYTADGAADNSFGVNGKVITKIGNYYDDLRSLLLQPDGKIVALGQHTKTLYEETQVAMIRYQSNGLRDSTFGVNGIVLTAIDSMQGSGGIALQPDGSLVVTGYVSDNQGGYNNFFVARYLSGLNVGVLDVAPAVQATYVYPNPLTAPTLTVQYELHAPAEVSFDLFSNDGQRSWRLGAVQQGSGEQKSELSLPTHLPAGAYVLRVQTPNGSAAIQLVKL